MIELYKKMLNDFGTSRELVSANYSCEFDNMMDCLERSRELFEYAKNDILITRKDNELHFHNFLKHQMFCHLQEIKYYSEVNLNDTRRFISVSQDCISAIQILIRDKMHLNIYFRSSDFDGALPADLLFLCELPKELILHCLKLRGVKEYSEVDDEFIRKLTSCKIQLNLMFGSLHRTSK